MAKPDDDDDDDDNNLKDADDCWQAISWVAWIAIGTNTHEGANLFGFDSRETFEAYGGTLNDALDSLSCVLEEEGIETSWRPPQDFQYKKEGDDRGLRSSPSFCIYPNFRN